jgi:peptide/nickel transport system permease protein
MAGGSSAHFLGTDLLGRDMLARILAGGRTSMLIGVCAVAVSCVIGVTLGAVAAEWGGWLDEVLMRIADVQLAIPFILLAVAVLLLAGGSDLNLVLVLGISGWVVLARVVRSELLHVRELDFVQASRALGGGRRHVIVRDLLPNVTGLILVTATFQLAEFILLESALSFLGIGIQPPQVSLGSILADGQNYLTTAWWIATFPGVAITTLILGVNLVGDSAGDSADPRAVRA